MMLFPCRFGVTACRATTRIAFSVFVWISSAEIYCPKDVSMKLLLKSAVFALLLCASSVAFGQSLVEGTVIFGNRFKPVPDVNVHLVNKSQKPPLDRILKTGSDGRYTFDDVPP